MGEDRARGVAAALKDKGASLARLSNCWGINSKQTN